MKPDIRTVTVEASRDYWLLFLGWMAAKNMDSDNEPAFFIVIRAAIADAVNPSDA
jgi:hypothetical protein